MEALYQEHKDEGLMIVTLLMENYDKEPPSQSELVEWAEQYEQTFPVLSDAPRVADRFTERGEVSLPSHSVIGPGAEVLVADGNVTEEEILGLLESAFR